MNLLLNPTFEFHCFNNHRLGQASNFDAGYVAFWNTEAWDDIRVVREAHLDGQDNASAAEADKLKTIRPDQSVGNLVAIKPGKKLTQFFTLPEAGLAHGERISLRVYGYQNGSNALSARIRLMKLDSQDGTWCPKDFGMQDARTFPRHSRGELVVAKEYEAHTNNLGRLELAIENAEIVGHFHEGQESHADDVNTIGIEVVFANTGTKDDVWIAAPCLSRGAVARKGLPTARAMTPYYRYIPRTIQKLWKGEAIHILVMGSSIDRGSANPPLYCYDEDPASAKFKQPLSDGLFDPARSARPDLDGYVGEWRHYWSWAGRLRLELMRKFNLPADKILLHFMACDGSCVAEAHSGLEDYCTLALPPDPGVNGLAKGKTWRELYPDLFARPGGPRPDLVLFGSGANEKVDTPDEVAVFEGAIRWIQRHYPDTEFLFSMFQNRGSYTSNIGDLQALSLRYQIPMLDCGQVLDEVTRWCNRYTLVPADGHPQAAAHYLWFKQLEKAFECWDPILPGQAQLQLPERVHANTYGWEGDMVTFTTPHPRINNNTRLILEDTAVNLWATVKTNTVEVWVDGVKQTAHRGSSFSGRDPRNSSFAYGRLSFGDRHIVETTGASPCIVAADCKVCPDRTWVGVESTLWRTAGLNATPFNSQWGAPYGGQQILLPPGRKLELDVVATDVSVAYADAPTGGVLVVTVDGQERLRPSANQPYVDIATNRLFLENRKGILNLGYGIHTVRLEAVGAPVTVLGLFSYDARANRSHERRLSGWASAGQVLTFSAPFKTRPIVMCQGALMVKPEAIFADRVTFAGTGAGLYEIIGE